MSALFHRADQRVEEVLRSARGRDDLHRPAPGDAGISDRPELARIGVQRELVQDASATLAGLRVRVRTHRMDAPIVGKAQHIGRMLFLRIEHHRSEEHTSELQSLMRISYAVFCLNKKNNN